MSDAIIRSGGKGRFVRDSRSRGMSRRKAGRLRSRSLAPSLLSCSTPVDRRIKEDASVETVRDLKRARFPAKGLPSGRWKRRRRRRRSVNGGNEFTPRLRFSVRILPPVYMANVGSNSSWLVATKSIPDSPLSFTMHRNITRTRW